MKKNEFAILPTTSQPKAAIPVTFVYKIILYVSSFLQLYLLHCMVLVFLFIFFLLLFFYSFESTRACLSISGSLKRLLLFSISKCFSALMFCKLAYSTFYICICMYIYTSLTSNAKVDSTLAPSTHCIL